MPEYTKEQRQAVFHDKGDILVSASAGSGKTYVMIERLIRLVSEKKAGVKDILAVTFTEAAASEMKEKLKKALNDKISEGNLSLIPEVLEVSTADISTMHSFCGKLIRTHFYTVGVAPDFKIIDAQQASTLKEDCMQKTFRELYESKEPWFINLLDCHAKKRLDGGLKALVFSLYDFFESEADPEKSYSVFEELYSEKGFEAVCKDYKKLIDEKLINYLDRLKICINYLNAKGLKKGSDFCLQLFNDLSSMLSENLFGLKKFENYSLKLSFETKLSEEATKIKEETKEIRESVKDLIKEACASFSDSISERQKLPHLMEHAKNLVKVLRAFKQTYANAKSQDNLLDFNDLEHFALKVLQDDTAREAIQAKYKYIFIDEYQDTNGVQESIINMLSSNNVFMVGDEKQSIYGFRGCRPEFFRDKFEKMKKNGQTTVVLNDNFRSCQAVLDAVNQIFGYAMTSEFYGSDYRGNFDLKNGKVYPDEYQGRFALHYFHKTRAEKAPPETPRVYDVLEELDKPEDEEISGEVALICDIILKELGKEYYDFKEKTTKRIGYSDIAILAGHSGNAYVTKMVNGLVSRNIPVTSSVKQNLCDFPEIMLFIALLNLLDNSKQDIPLATVLKSPIVGLTDEDLAEIVTYFRNAKEIGGFYSAVDFYAENNQSEIAKKLIKFKNYLEKTRLLADYYGASDILERVILDCSLMPYFYAQTNGESAVRRIKQFISLARSGSTKQTIKEFLKKIKASPESFQVAECNEENTVRVMTVHASKGLEFPVVIVVETASRFIGSGVGGDEVLLDREYGFALKYYDVEERKTSETILRSLIKLKAKNDNMKEAMRLFYVATTRAKYSMHLVYGSSKDNRKERFTGAKAYVDFIPLCIESKNYQAEDFDFINLKDEKRTVLLSKSDIHAEEQMRKNFSFRYPCLEETALPLKTGVTTAIKDSQEDVHVYYVYQEDKTDAERGVIAHKIMELYNPNGKDFLTQVQNMIDDGCLTKEQVEKINLSRLKKVIEDGALKNFTGKLYREQPFMVNVPANLIFPVATEENVLVQGIIDLLEINGETARIADYKYSALTVDSLVSKYRKQLDLYTYAVEKVTGKKVVERVLINVYSGETVKI